MNMKRLALAVVLSTAAVSASANTALDAVRDNLKGSYNAIAAGSWGITHTEGSDAIAGIAEYATGFRNSVDITFTNDGYITAVRKSNGTFDSDEWDGKVTALTTGVLTDMYGTATNLGNLITVDSSNDYQLSTSMDTDALAYTDFSGALTTLNDAVFQEGVSDTDFDAAVATFTTAVTNINTLSTSLTTERAKFALVTDAAGAKGYGLFKMFLHDITVFASEGSVYCSYTDYAVGGTPVVSDWDGDAGSISADDIADCDG